MAEFMSAEIRPTSNRDRRHAALTICDRLDYEHARIALLALGLIAIDQGSWVLVRDQFDRSDLTPPFVADADRRFTR